MALYYNSNNVPQSNNVYHNSNASNKVYHNNNLVWQKQKTIYPGVPVANTQNLGYAAYFTVTNSGSDIKVDAFGGTERGYGRVMLGGFSTIGYSQIYFANLRAFITNSFSHIKVALSDINGNVVQQLIYSEANGFDTTYTASTKFNINSPNGNYYLMLEVESGATHLGKNATILMNGCYLI
ncbi:hypothetical protein [Ruthenibacterium lactatiformans]|uniref:hypothetical protein n=1 Tax=Ruthenibacterium lactatiformans TaxID=1550024 RepID=UPI0022DFA9E3|nr:hypothetical protein [Ruthenibacterium lactatiformans]